MVPWLAASLAVASPLADWSGSVRVTDTRQHGCSRSFANDTETLDVMVSVRADGTARVELARREFSISGPYGHEPTRLTTLESHTLTGTSAPSGDGWLVTLTADQHAAVRFSGWGSLPLPAPSTRRGAWSLRCEPAAHTLDGAQTATPALTCRFDGDAPAGGARLTSGVPIIAGRALALTHDGPLDQTSLTITTTAPAPL